MEPKALITRSGARFLGFMGRFLAAPMMEEGQTGDVPPHFCRHISQVEMQRTKEKAALKERLPFQSLGSCAQA
jgi:hypothetical protein